VETTLNDKEELKHQYWTAEVVGELLAYAPHISEPPGKEQIAIVMSLCLEHYAQGNVNTLARLVKLNKQPLWSYIQGTRVPYFDTLLHLCSALSITPVEFLTTKLPPDQRNPQFVVDNLPVVSHGRGKPISAEDVQRMRQILEVVIAEERDPPPSLREVANISGYPTYTIRKHCPDLSKRISTSYRRRWTEDDFHRMKQELENALRSDQPVPLSTLVQQLNCGSEVLRKHFPDHCAAIVMRYRERFNYEQMQRRLQEVLANEEETLSVFEIAREMGYNYTIFKDNFPALCNQIKKRCATARRKHHDERVAMYCNEIRQVALILHDQGKYPSSWQIVKQLSDPHTIRTKEGHETWRQILEELGYPTGHLEKFP